MPGVIGEEFQKVRHNVPRRGVHGGLAEILDLAEEFVMVPVNACDSRFELVRPLEGVHAPKYSESGCSSQQRARKLPDLFTLFLLPPVVFKEKGIVNQDIRSAILPAKYPDDLWIGAGKPLGGNGGSPLKEKRRNTQKSPL